MGLFDMFSGTPQSQGLLAAAAQILQASAPSRTPTGLGQILGGGLMAGQQATYDAQQRAQQQQIMDLKTRDAEADFANQQLLRDQKLRIAKRMAGQGSAPTSAQAPQMMASAAPGVEGSPKIGGPDWLQAYQQQNGLGLLQPGVGAGGKPINQTDAYVQRLLSAAQVYAEEGDIDGANKLYEQASKLRPEFDTTPRTGTGADGKPFQYILGKRGEMQRLEGVLPREKLENVNGVWSNPFSQRDGAAAPQDVNKPFMAGPNGEVVPNRAFQQFEVSKARAGASSVSVNTATKPFLSEIGKGAGEAVNTAYQGALAAARTLQNVEQIRSGLGNAIIGPGANARVTLAQIGQTLGVTGKSTSEQLANTRMVVQGLARQELSAAESMKGQGQITESERGILRRAESGMIGDMTAPELNTLLGALDKTARYRISAHEANMQRLQADPNAQGIVDYMRVDVPKAAGSSNNGVQAYSDPAKERRYQEWKRSQGK